MFWFLFLAQGFLPLLLCALFLGVKDYILGFAFLNVCYQALQILFNVYFPSSQIAGFKLIGLGFASILLFFVPTWILGIFNVVVSLAGKVYLMVEAVQVMTMVFQASRKMKEKMDSRPSFWGTLIIILTLVNIILTIVYDYHLSKSFDTATGSYDTSVLKIFLMTVYALQGFAIFFTLWKANYDSVILNSAAFAFYLSLKCYQIFRRRDVLGSSCLLKNYTSVNGIAKVLFYEREMYTQKGLEVLKSCINTDLINSLVIPASVFMVLPATIKEWKLFWSGDRMVENEDSSKKSQIATKLSQILSILAFTDILVQNEHSVSFNYINIITGSVFFVLKVVVADVYTH